MQKYNIRVKEHESVVIMAHYVAMFDSSDEEDFFIIPPLQLNVDEDDDGNIQLKKYSNNL